MNTTLFQRWAPDISTEHILIPAFKIKTCMIMVTIAPSQWQEIAKMKRQLL
jgi:hypothetical protein